MSKLAEDTRVSRPTERELIVMWREESLLEAGYPSDVALRLALLIDVDLHTAVDLIKAGCDPVIAEQILS